jgi:hypothetical protein
MRILIHPRRWRAAIGLIAAYAVCLQMLLGLQLGIGYSLDGNTFDPIICTGHGGDQGSAPGQPSDHAHCPICALQLLNHATLPERAVAPVVFASPADRLGFVSGTACISLHESKSALSRGPPSAA